MKDENYYIIQGWMVTRLKLQGTNLIIYAIIYGFSQDGETEYSSSINTLCKWTNTSRPTVMKALRELEGSGLISKRQETINSVTFNRYKTVLRVVKNLYRGSKESLPGGSKDSLLINNKEISNSISKEEKINKKENPKLKRTKKSKPTKKTLLEYFPNDWQINETFTKAVNEFIEHRKAIRKNLNELACQKLANHCTKFTIKEVCAAIDTSIMNGYTGLFPKTENKPYNQKQSNTLGTRSQTGRKVDYSVIEIRDQNGNIIQKEVPYDQR